MTQSPIPAQQPPQPKSMARQLLPWKADVLWWVIVAEGVIALLIGLYVILQPTQAGGILIQIIGGYVLFTSLLSIYQLIARKGEPSGSPGWWIRVGIGLIVGLVAVFYPMMSTIGAPAAATILAIGLLLIGIMGIYAIISNHAVAGWRWGQMLIYGLYILLAVMTFYRNISGGDSRALPILGWVLIIGGIALIGYGIWVYQKLSAERAAAITTTTPTAPQDLSNVSAVSTATTSESTVPQTSGNASGASTAGTPPASAKNSTVATDGSGKNNGAAKQDVTG